MIRSANSKHWLVFFRLARPSAVRSEGYVKVQKGLTWQAPEYANKKRLFYGHNAYKQLTVATNTLSANAGCFHVLFRMQKSRKHDRGEEKGLDGAIIPMCRCRCHGEFDYDRLGRTESICKQLDILTWIRLLLVTSVK